MIRSLLTSAVLRCHPSPSIPILGQGDFPTSITMVYRARSNTGSVLGSAWHDRVHPCFEATASPLSRDRPRQRARASSPNVVCWPAAESVWPWSLGWATSVCFSVCLSVHYNCLRRLSSPGSPPTPSCLVSPEVKQAVHVLYKTALTRRRRARATRRRLAEAPARSGSISSLRSRFAMVFSSPSSPSGDKPPANISTAPLVCTQCLRRGRDVICHVGHFCCPAKSVSDSGFRLASSFTIIFFD